MRVISQWLTSKLHQENFVREARRGVGRTRNASKLIFVRRRGKRPLGRTRRR